MLYLAGQILVFVLVALLIGAGLAWFFLAAPLRRQLRLAARPGATGAAAESAAPAAGPAPGTPVRPATDSAPHAATRESRAVVPAGDASVAAGTGALVDPHSAPGGGELEDVPGARPRVVSGPSPEELANLLNRLQEQERGWSEEKVALATRLAAAEQQAIDSAERVAAAERQVNVAQARIDEIESALLAAVVETAVTEAPAAALPTSPSSAAGGEEWPSGDPDDASEEPAESVADLARETAELREQLGEAEARAAKFSSRLAMVRTEAEEAQRQVATMSTRLDRHQAEWAAERIKLLARIADAEESRAAAQPVAPLAPELAVDLPDPELTMYPPDSEPAVDLTDPRPLSGTALELPSVPALPDVVPALPDVVPGGEADDLDTSVHTMDVGEHDSAEPSSPGRQAGPGAFDPGPLLDAIAGSRDDGLELIGAALVGAAASTAMREHQPLGASDGSASSSDAAGEEPSPPAPSWGGPAEPLSSTDNLKEIVGVGPVVETRLRVLGITTFRQLAAMGDTEVDRLAAMLDGFGGRIISDDWVGQARELQARHHSGIA